MYELHAVVGRAALLDAVAADSRHALVATLRQDLGMVLVTDDVVAELDGGVPVGRRPTDPAVASPAGLPVIRRALAEWSRPGPLAHVRVSFHGGDGDQWAEVWRDGARVWGPVLDTTFTGPRQDWPVNAALARLGARSSGRTYPHSPDQPVDLFDEVGLGLHRDMDEWLRYARDGLTPQRYDAWAEQRARHADLAELDRLPADLDGRAVMTILGVTGPAVGAALRHLRRLRRDHGALSREQAETALREWARDQHLP